MNSPAYDLILSGFTDYRSITNYWDLFSIADGQSQKSVRDTFKAIYKDAKKDYKLLTELVMVLNHKTWIWHENSIDQRLSRLYGDLFEEANSYAVEHLQGSEMRYFFEVTD